MGYSLSWLAFKNLAPEAGLSRLGLKVTNRLAEYAQAPISGQRLPDGWFLIVMKGYGHPLIGETSLASLSVAAEVVACSVEEHAMVSTAEGWSNGQREWRARHDAQQSGRHLAASGTLPMAYAEALRSAESAQDAEDAGDAQVDFFFEVPLQAARATVGFKHDEEIPGVKYDAFQVYDSASGNVRRKWWQVWK